MRVPVAPPPDSTYDETFHVGFWRWLTSSAAERRDWRARRNAAIHTSASIRWADRQGEQIQRKIDERKARRST